MDEKEEAARTADRITAIFFCFMLHGHFLLSPYFLVFIWLFFQAARIFSIRQLPMAFTASGFPAEITAETSPIKTPWASASISPETSAADPPVQPYHAHGLCGLDDGRIFDIEGGPVDDGVS